MVRYYITSMRLGQASFLKYHIHMVFTIAPVDLKLSLTSTKISCMYYTDCGTLYTYIQYLSMLPSSDIMISMSLQFNPI